MSLEEDILSACMKLIKKSQNVVTYAGIVQNYDVPTNTVTFIVDGASAGIPCIPLDQTVPVIGLRGVALQVGDTYYFIGRLGNRVTSLPNYTGSHPTSNPGDMWFRSDLGHAYINIAGVATQVV